MSQIQVVGLDLAKQVFQVHAIAADGSVVVKRQLRRSQVLTFSRSWSLVLSVWRRVAEHISGPARSLRLGTACG